MPDLGNSNFFTTFKGRYEITPVAAVGSWDSHVVMLSCVNDVQIMGDLTLKKAYKEGTVVGVLPPEVRPIKTIAFPVIYETSSPTYGLMGLGILPNGNIVLGRASAINTVIRTNGCQFNISNNWY